MEAHAGSKQPQKMESDMKMLVDQGCTLAEAFLRTFASADLQKQQATMDRILGKLSIRSSDNDYCFVDGSRLSIDPAVESMLATKSSSSIANISKPQAD